MFSPSKAGTPHRHGRGGGSPNSSNKRDPSTPSRTVRSTKTPPASELTKLPPVFPTTHQQGTSTGTPPQRWAGVTAVDESIDDVATRSRSPTPVGDVPASSIYPAPLPTVDAVGDADFRRTPGRGDGSSERTSPAQRPGGHGRSSSATPYDDDDFESSDGDGEAPPTPPVVPRPSEVTPRRKSVEGPKRSASPTLPAGREGSSSGGRDSSGHREDRHRTERGTKKSTGQPSTAPASIVPDEREKGSEESPKKRKHAIEVNLGTKQLIGQGSYGNVYRAVDVLTNRLVAVKEILFVEDELRDLKKQINAIEREIRVMQKLDHPNIVKYLGAKRVGGALYLYMEFVPGGTISNFLENFGPLSELQATQFTAQILSGLNYLHSRKIAHRDLKGENLFVDANGNLKLGDFGTSKELQTLRCTKTVAGTPYFMAPEVINCSGHGLEADIWSVGCVVIQMLTGKPPFHDCDNAFAVMFQVTKGEMGGKIPSSVSPEARDFITQCVRMDPKERPTTQALLQHPWLREAAEKQAQYQCASPVASPSIATATDHGVQTTLKEETAAVIQAHGGVPQDVGNQQGQGTPVNASSSTEMQGDRTPSSRPSSSVERLRSRMPSKGTPPPSTSTGTETSDTPAGRTSRSPPPSPPIESTGTGAGVVVRKSSKKQVGHPSNITVVGTSTLPRGTHTGSRSPPPAAVRTGSSRTSFSHRR